MNGRFSDMKSCYWLFTLITSALFFVSCGGEKSAPNAPKPLVVGMELAYPPFEMRNTKNQPDGISVRMAEALAAQLGRPLKIEDISWDGIIPALKNGKIDLIISSMTRTVQREAVIDFSDGYVTNGLCMLVPKNSDIRNIDDLSESGAKIAVKLATTGHQWAMGHLEGVDLVTLDEAATCVMEVVQGKADAFIYDQISIYQHWKNNQETTRPILKPIREETWAIGIKKGNAELKTQVNAFLKKYREDGKFDDLADRYMAEEKRAFKEMGVPFIFH